MLPTGKARRLRLPRLHRAGPSTSLDKSAAYEIMFRIRLYYHALGRRSNLCADLQTLVRTENGTSCKLFLKKNSRLRDGFPAAPSPSFLRKDMRQA